MKNESSNKYAAIDYAVDKTLVWKPLIRDIDNPEKNFTKIRKLKPRQPLATS